MFLFIQKECPKNFAFLILRILEFFTVKFVFFLKNWLLFYENILLFLYVCNQTFCKMLKVLYIAILALHYFLQKDEHVARFFYLHQCTFKITQVYKYIVKFSAKHDLFLYPIKRCENQKFSKLFSVQKCNIGKWVKQATDCYDEQVTDSDLFKSMSE